MPSSSSSKRGSVTDVRTSGSTTKVNVSPAACGSVSNDTGPGPGPDTDPAYRPASIWVTAAVAARLVERNDTNVSPARSVVVSSTLTPDRGPSVRCAKRVGLGIGRRSIVAK